MGRMDMHSRKEYLRVLRERYWRARGKKEKRQILSEIVTQPLYQGKAGTDTHRGSGQSPREIIEQAKRESSSSY